MFRALDGFLVVTVPILAAVFAYDLYAGKPADWCVWFYAFIGLFYTFLSAARGIAKN